MNINGFIELLVEELELETVLSLETNLKELDEWDSMAAMVLIGVVSENFGIQLNGNDISEITTIESLIERIGQDNFN